MSRIGKLPVSIPAGVTVTLKDNIVNVKGPKGELSQFVNPAISVEIADGHVVLKENFLQWRKIKTMYLTI